MRQDGGDGSRVVSFSNFMTASKFNAVQEVEAYWEAIRAGRLVPRRADIDPRGIERALEFAFVLERVAPGIARLRIAGSHLSDLMGMEVRGMPVSSFVTPQSRNRMGDALEQVFDSPAKVTVDLESEGGLGKPTITGRMILLPMKSDLGDISRALGCFATTGEIGRTPRRFEVTDTHVRPLLGDFMAKQPEPQETRPARRKEQIVTETPQPPHGSRVPEPGDAFDRAPRKATATGAVRMKPGPRPYLSVVDTDRD